MFADEYLLVVVLSFTLAALAMVSFVLTLWQYTTARRFPVHQRVPGLSSHPGITLLKPLKGCDSETERCLRSWFEQSYAGPVQILMGVAGAEDPVCELARELLAAYPKVAAELVLCPERLGPNAKV